MPDLAAVLEDAQIKHRGLIIAPAPGAPAVVRVGHPLRDRGEKAGRSCPAHGEHTVEILGELGLSGAELDELEAAGVIRRGP